MRVLWITNMMVVPSACESDKFRGGWMVGALDYLIQKNEYEISIAYPNGTDMVNRSKVKYYSFNYDMNRAKCNHMLIEQLQSIIYKVNPDIIHIWGTEYLHSYAAVSAAEKLGMVDKTIINIQGLVSVCAQHYAPNIEYKYKVSRTIIDFVFKGSINQQVTIFKKRGYWEKETIKKAKHVIGRTEWDRACTRQISQDINYHFCNEILRDVFYDGSLWNSNDCKKHSIFISQATYPIKGLHYILKALIIILREYPDTVLYIAGENIFQKKCRVRFIDSYMLMNTYERYLYNIVKKNNLMEHITFLGALSAEKMKEQYLQANVFVSASTIENESNSISEAKILGVPVVSSFVGGVTDRIMHKVDGFVYPMDEPYMLAHYVMKIFSDDELASKVSVKAHESAVVTLSKEINGKALIEIYRTVMEDGN